MNLWIGIDLTILSKNGLVSTNTKSYCKAENNQEFPIRLLVF